ncbi:type I 3-dehydroquinate dehydratase [Listeria welshimeri]|uniref:type I 3-dehydroquinate dehydratase n=1 Tax=Listeria welshimeri TaxID=1643 RepID=UPI0018875CD5|nr:type I 3-dehydroquinate dehydratase [Listeria welshimeri]MBF2574966.1 type I 3-dehydroquinate dehydratase [Listeria welshimeri]
MNKVVVKNVAFGEGAPKICVPMVGKTVAALKEEAEMLKTIDLDVVEWRVDFYEDVKDLAKVENALDEIRVVLPETPILFTFRSAKEGGELAVSDEFYFELNETLARTGKIDLVDVELFNEEADVLRLIETAHKHDVKVVMSNHDFDKTPAKEEIVSRLTRMEALGADLPKIAVMPKSATDVLTLLDATNTVSEKANQPIITMSMAGTGVISRLAGEVFGSAMTFGAAKKASAPGQIDVNELRHVLDLLHKQF